MIVIAEMQRVAKFKR